MRKLSPTIHEFAILASSATISSRPLRSRLRDCNSRRTMLTFLSAMSSCCMYTILASYASDAERQQSWGLKLKVSEPLFASGPLISETANWRIVKSISVVGSYRCGTKKIVPDILPTPPLIFTRGQKSEICPRFLILVASEALWLVYIGSVKHALGAYTISLNVVSKI